MATSYSEKLKDPRWQRKRLEILQRDEWTCLYCRSTDVTLHVHHEYYEKGKEPWEADEIFLSTLCKDCHSVTHKAKTPLENFLLSVVRAKMEPEDIKLLNKVIQASF